MTRRLPRAALAVLAAPLLAPAVAPAREGPGVTVRALPSNADSQALVRLLVTTTPGFRCVGAVSHYGVTLRLPQLPIGGSGGGLWSWALARGVPAGAWAGGVSCSGPGDTFVTTIAFDTGPGPKGAWRPRVLARRGSVRAERYSQTGKGGIGCFGCSNPYPTDTSTWWAWKLRPDLPYFPGRDGEAGNWFRAARAQDVPTGTRPVTGAVAVWSAGQRGAGEYGHVAYVERVRGATIVVSEAGWGRVRPGHRRRTRWRGLRFLYGGPAGGGPGHPAPRPPNTAPLAPPPNAYAHRVIGTCANGHCGLPVRAGPGAAYPAARELPDGAEADVVCQTRGEAVTGVSGSSSDVWDQLADGGYVADYYLDTPGTLGDFSPPIPNCATSPPPVKPFPYHVTHTCADGHCGLAERTGPSSAFAIVATLLDGTEVDIVCQTVGERVTGLQGSSSPIWDHLADGDYVPDYYVDTSGTLGEFTPPIPHCGS